MRKINFDKILYMIMSFLLLIFVGYISLANIIPFKYIVVIFIIMLLWDISLYFTLVYKTKVGKNKKRKVIGYIISAFLIIVMGLISYYIFNTMNFFRSFGNNTYKEENYLILIRNESNYTKLEDLNNMGYVKQEVGNLDKAIEQIKQKSIEMTNYEHYNIMMKDLMDFKIESVLIEESYYGILDESLNYSNYFKILDTISIRTEIEVIQEEVDVTNSPFSIYISGIDTYGNISGVSRSDVNMVVTINPVTKQILFISIPRDYYVQLKGTTGYKDKLTHAGVFGIDTSIGTIEDLLDVDINYYFRVNFSTLEKVIDAIDGVDVYSKYSFTSHPYSGGTYYFSKGYNHLNGKQALCFSRERYNLPNGDRDRGVNQQAVLDGIVRKATSPAIITKYTAILNSLKGTFQTNMTDTDIQKLIKMQLNDMASWNITSYSLNGYDGEYEYTYSNPYQKSYVMHPDEETVETSKNMIDKVYNGETLESSYGDVGKVNTPVEVTPPPTEEPTETPEEPLETPEEPVENPNETPTEPSNPTEEPSDSTDEPVETPDNSTNEQPTTPEDIPNNETPEPEEDNTQEQIPTEDTIDSSEDSNTTNEPTQEEPDTTQDSNDDATEPVDIESGAVTTE